MTFNLPVKKIASLTHELGTGGGIQAGWFVNPQGYTFVSIVNLDDEPRWVTMDDEEAVLSIIGNEEFGQRGKVGGWAHGVGRLPAKAHCGNVSELAATMD